MISLRGGFPFLLGPLEWRFTVLVFCWSPLMPCCFKGFIQGTGKGVGMSTNGKQGSKCVKNGKKTELGKNGILISGLFIHLSDGQLVGQFVHWLIICSLNWMKFIKINLGNEVRWSLAHSLMHSIREQVCSWFCWLVRQLVCKLVITQQKWRTKTLIDT